MSIVGEDPIRPTVTGTLSHSDVRYMPTAAELQRMGSASCKKQEIDHSFFHTYRNSGTVIDFSDIF